MLKLETEFDLTELHIGNVKESLHLEYKASDAIDKRDDKKKLEMARDVSAFANADGGQIIYGMTEKDHEPNGIDAGLDPKEYPELWFSQVLQQHITPDIGDLSIKHVPLATGRVAVVISIPASRSDPHQVSEGKYFRRHEYNKLAMDHYEIRDKFRRVVAPDLGVDFFFDNMADTHPLRWNKQDDQIPAGLTPVVTNTANQPALYAVVSVFIDKRLQPRVNNGVYPRVIEAIRDGKKTFCYQAHFNASLQMPIFAEQPIMLPNIGLVISDNELYTADTLYLGYEVRAPGCYKEGRSGLTIEQGKLLRVSR